MLYTLIMKKIFKKELVLLFIFFVGFIFVRSVYFTQHLNFSDDQGVQATDILQDYRQHKIPLIGNRASSPSYQGHYIYQGPAYYYMFFPFLFLTNFEPISSSYLFMLFCAFMVVPLYYGMKLLIDKRAALLMVLIYSLLPYYLNYTRFHWNPNYQLSLLPVLLLLMGLYKKYHSQKFFLLIAIFLGFLFQFHYQFIFVLLGIAIYYFLIKRVSPILLIHFLIGLAIGVSPLLLFELKHNFYHIHTFLLFIQHRNELSSAGSITTPHYYLSISFMFLVAVLAIIRNRLKYLLKRDNVSINYEDYYHNKYLFVIKKTNTNVYDTLSYEVAFFKPSKILKTWTINNHYKLYLLERL